MSSYLNYYIEYKRNNKWNLLYALVPEESIDYPECYSKFEFGEHKTFRMVLEDSSQGYIRDTMSDHGWSNAPFTGRGFPEDMSEALATHIDLEKQSEWEEQKKNLDPDFEYKGYSLEKVPRTEPLSFEKDYRDYRYDKTYATLEELNNFYLKELDKAKKAIEKYNEDKSFNRLEKKLDDLEQFIKTGKETKPKKKKPEEIDDYDSLPDLEENLQDVELLGNWINGINMIVDFLTCSWNDLEDIRIISYIS